MQSAVKVEQTTVNLTVFRICDDLFGGTVQLVTRELSKGRTDITKLMDTAQVFSFRKH